METDHLPAKTREFWLDAADSVLAAPDGRRFLVHSTILALASTHLAELYACSGCPDTVWRGRELKEFACLPAAGGLPPELAAAAANLGDFLALLYDGSGEPRFEVRLGAGGEQDRRLAVDSGSLVADLLISPFFCTSLSSTLRFPPHRSGPPSPVCFA